VVIHKLIGSGIRNQGIKVISGGEIGSATLEYQVEFAASPRKLTPIAVPMNLSFRFGRFELRPASRQLLVDGQGVALGARAFDVLRLLIEHRERIVLKDELLDIVWSGLVVEENNLQVQISTLRKILGRDAVSTVPGRGYQFCMELENDNPKTNAAYVERPSIDTQPRPLDRPWEMPRDT
jgi:DNA-binding winged helix-turn-helix (wHTH) protein